MTDNLQNKHASYTKIAWTIYSILAAIIVAVLVLVVAQDNEERFFYGLMTTAVAYVFRPTEKFFNRLILKYTGVEKPAEQE
ncbi:hypothetical protein [Oceanicoccus sp. KOV_DT_Chl]|uniref:hypothetical protein n=1 Tax=Oceanicoccus sp. KOV_DT_Chl TaxID=1904639 RepID=UPI000C7CCE82|nr:hypothetical protein [Oceanicoccus sp. KOV_DT_Chl]